ncbi:hypothetical protein D9757_008780 [Collybiopsis confluens]|uniref:UvrD-like helicase ATP-binding domain-containing protein n=1 Tax=Collybiopsis confluens TaxID=2823264 RepID=A0A8H5H5Q4_9AGAR|nr:hypothetical protein D9757_008780 [Collybiopsis confluens]
MSTKIPNDLLSLSRLTSLAEADEALAQFEIVVSINYHRPGLLLAEILENQLPALPLVLSCINDDAFSPIKAHIDSSFSPENEFSTDSVGFQVLANLTHFLYFHTAAPSGVITQDYCRKVEDTTALLKLLPTMDFVQEASIPNEELEDFGVRVRVRGKKIKKDARAKTSITVNAEPFKNLALQVPLNQTEADQVKSQLLRTLKNILDFYFSILRDEEFSFSIKLSFVSPLTTEQPTMEVIESNSAEDKAAPSEAPPAAFPKIQPMKSALYFDTVQGFGEWSILISQKADAELRSRHRKDKHLFDIIVKKIKELSNGHFSPDNQKRLSGPGSEVPVFEAKMTADLRLIYQIDIVTSDDERDKQAIKVFGIYTHAQMDSRMWESICHQLSRKGRSYHERCAVRKPAQNADGQTFVPALFPPLPEVQEEEGSYNWLSERDDPVYSRFLMDKYVVFSQPLLNTMMADLDATFPHLVSAKEKQIIEHPDSCYVIGRSGTGKTTALLFKMLLVERTHQLTEGDAPKPRQIFVTQSRILAKKVEQYYQTLGRSLTAASQIVARLSESPSTVEHAVPDTDIHRAHADDRLDWNATLPSKFSELNDAHFPLFTTFNALCSLLEADIAAAESPMRKSSEQSTNVDLSERGSLVMTYDDFYRDYWPHFPQALTSKLDPTLVFSELIGVIKGSEETLQGPTSYLERSVYHNLSTRSHSTFANSRADLYDLFNVYMTKQKRTGDVDAADRAHRILTFVKTGTFPWQKVDHL